MIESSVDFYWGVRAYPPEDVEPIRRARRLASWPPTLSAGVGRRRPFQGSTLTVGKGILLGLAQTTVPQCVVYCGRDSRIRAQTTIAVRMSCTTSASFPFRFLAMQLLVVRSTLSPFSTTRSFRSVRL
ncbi:hypothetical protein PI124_g2912 [Phytophthora idaei]|nr:hypothetical protein PI124_g2912 [Phytophthora idaei]